MGAGKTKIKVPAVVQGQILYFTGIKEFDRYFIKGEGILRKIDEANVALDMLTMDFVKALGAEKHWEMNPDLKILISMMLAVLSTRGKGSLSYIELVYSHETPFLDANPKKLSMSQRRVLETYKLLTYGLVEFPERLEFLRAPLLQLSAIVGPFPETVAEKTEALRYKMQDKILAV
jgi:hypothetical protein